jgi:hypothetical protein
MFRVLLATFLILAATLQANAQGSHHGGKDRASLGNDIIVGPDETVGDVACAFCSVYLHGDAKGDVAVFMGNVILDKDHTISGDLAVFGGDVNVADDATINGDLAVFAGNLNLSPDAAVHGSRSVFGGRIWLLAALAPFLILAGIIWLIVWLIRRSRDRAAYARQGYPVRRF